MRPSRLNPLLLEKRDLDRSFAGARSVVDTGPADLPEQQKETVFVLRGEVRPLAPRFHCQVADLPAFIGREPIPIIAPLGIQPQDGRQDFAPRDFPYGGESLQDPRRHWCCGYPSRRVSNGDGQVAKESR